MARQPSVFTTLAVLIAAAAMYEPPAIGQSADVFTLGFEGPRSLAGRADTQVYASYHATLAHQGEGNGAEAWSLGVTIEHGSILSTGVSGTASDLFQFGGYRNPLGSFERTALVHNNPGWSQATGVVSTVVLSTREDEKIALPPRTTMKVLAMVIEGRVSVGGGTAWG